MTRHELADALSAYVAGLDAEIGLLRQVGAMATAQRQIPHSDDLSALSWFADRRNRLMSALAELEHSLHPIRTLIVQDLTLARTLPSFEGAAQRHREAAELITSIMSTDRTLMTLLEEALDARRQLAHELDAGGTTLAAYRRVLSPAAGKTGLVDRMG